jgi:hypothetical protein
MSILGSILKRGLVLRKRATLRPGSPYSQQHRVLIKLLTQAEHTEFGRHFQFNSVLQYAISTDKHSLYDQFKANVPIFDYNSIYNAWWHRTVDGESNVTWPGVIKYFALSSGTSEASTKRIPVSRNMLKSMQRAGLKQLLALPSKELPDNVFNSGVLMLGGSTDLNKRGHYYEGDMSGIQTAQLPAWFQRFYKPGKKIAYVTDWEQKLDEITKKAKDWNIGYVTGVPSWVQILFERIIAYYKVDNIHQIWPNLSVYVHGGISFEPYRKRFQALLGRPIIYLETYIASEGFIAYQYSQGRNMQLVLNNGLFMEFVPFDEHNFTAEGDLVANPTCLMIDQVDENQDYAILLSTNAGAWRYLIGDVIKVTDKKNSEIIITGRTKHYISLCGEHLSVDNMNHAMLTASQKLGIDIREFTVAGVPSGTLFAHHWFIGLDAPVVPSELIHEIDEALKVLNDDYAVERIGPLVDVRCTIVPELVFYDFMKSLGKAGGQNKFPRVMKGKQLELWLSFLLSKGYQL